MLAFIRRFRGDESGATAIEYGLIAAMIGVVIAVAVTGVGAGVGARFNNVANATR